MSRFGLFAKHPRVGAVKTRLAAEIGAAAAAKLYAAFVRDMSTATLGGGRRRVWAYTPDDPAARQWFENLSVNADHLWPQPSGTLGDRLAAFFAAQFGTGSDRVVVIGSDSPTLPTEYLNLAFERLATYDAVLGPATDGGYYLLGLRRESLRSQLRMDEKASSLRIEQLSLAIGGGDPAPAGFQSPMTNRQYPMTNLPPALESTVAPPWPAGLFDGIAWSGPDVLQQTVARIRAAGRSLSLLPPWYDVDTADDLQTLRRHLSAVASAGLPSPCPETQAVLSQLEP